MKTINIKGQIYRDEYLAKPKYFFQIENLDKKTSHQFYNRKVTVEYVYDIDFELNRNISKDEICKIENALKSVVFCYADRARDALFIYDRMIHAYTGIFNFMHDGDMKINYLAKRYILGSVKDIAFATDYETIVDNKEEVKDLI